MPRPARFQLAGTTHRLAVAGFVLFLVALLIGLATWSSMGRDNDLWTHLSAGRYIVANAEVPSDSFASFLEPPRGWVDYAWLFQLVAYGLHQTFGMFGLVLLRGIAFALTLVTVLALLNPRREKTFDFNPLALGLMVVYALALLPRFTTPRPHIFTLLGIAACLYLLESRPRRMWLLPLATLVWMNGHGIAYPLMFVVIGCYQAETVVERLRGSSWSRADRAQLIWGTVAMATFVVTPVVTRVISVPFRSLDVISDFILELRPVDLFSLLQWSVGPEGIGTTTAMNVIRASIVAAVFVLALRRRLRIAHTLLVIGAVLLMFRGARFEYMALLLPLPVLASAIAEWEPSPRSRATVSAAACLVALLGAYSLLPFFRLQDEEVVPYATHGAPRGVAAFLEREGRGGRILNRPDIGGYLNWKLYPGYEITAEMQTPYVFSEADVFHAAKALNDEMLFRRLMTEYRPEYIVAPLGNAPFARYALERTPFVPVFFDEMTALFVHREARPDEVAGYALRALDLRADLFQQAASLTGEELEAATREVDRMLGVDPDGGLLHLLAASLRLRAGDTRAAETHAVASVRRLQGSPRAHATLADVYAAQQEWRKAAASYRRSIDRSSEKARPGIYRKLGRCYTQLERHGDAYSAMRRSIDPTSADTSPADLYELALGARRAGKEAEARLYLRFADLQTPPGDSEWRRRIDDALRDGGSE